MSFVVHEGAVTQTLPLNLMNDHFDYATPTPPPWFWRGEPSSTLHRAAEKKTVQHAENSGGSEIAPGRQKNNDSPQPHDRFQLLFLSSRDFTFHACLFEPSLCGRMGTSPSGLQLRVSVFTKRMPIFRSNLFLLVLFAFRRAGSSANDSSSSPSRFVRE